MNVRRSAALGASALLVAAHAVLVVDGARKNGGVYDETVYPAAGYSYLTTADYRMNPEHPPLLKLWTGLSWLGSGLDVVSRPGWAEGLEWPFGQDVLYRSAVPPGTLLLRARIMVAALSLALALAVGAVARREGGPAAGVAAVALYALDPLVIAHAGLATTDLGAALFYFLSAIAIPPALARGGTARVAGAGLALGAALSSKFSTLPLVVCLGALAVAFAWRKGEVAPGSNRFRPAIRPLVRGFAIAAIAVVVLVASYGSAGPGRFVDGMRFLWHHQETGHGAYAFGRYSTSGWWWYFPAAWAVKTPFPILLATAAGLALALARLRYEVWTLGARLAFMVAFAAPAMASSIQIGVRHLLPLTPFLAVLGGCAVARLLASGNAGRVVVACGAAWLAVGSVVAHPYELAYSNEAVGGPKSTWRVLADSNVDWGQDLPRLAEEIHRQPLRRLYLGYLGSADPAAYALPYCRIPSVSFAPPRCDDGPDRAGREWIAVSTTTLLDVMVEGHAAYRWLRERPMTRLVGTSIALYDVTGDAQAHGHVASTALAFDEVEAAEPALRRVVELRPERADALLALARVQASLGRFVDAKASCDAASRIGSSPEVEETCARIRSAAARAEPGRDAK